MRSEREKARWWWPQCGLRSVAVLFAVAGLLFWGVRKYVDRIHEKEKIAVAIAQVEDWGGEVTYEIPTPRGLPAKVLLWCETAVLGEEFTAQPVAISIRAFDVYDNRSLYGKLVDGYVNVVPTIAQVPSIRRLMLHEVRLREDSLIQLGSLRNLEVLYLATNGIDGQWLRHLNDLNKLQRMSIRFNDIQDDDLKYLRKLTNLEELYLDGTRITRVGLGYLAEQKNLRRVSWVDPYSSGQVAFTGGGPPPTTRRLTETEVAEIKSSLPHCQIVLDGKIYRLDVTY